MPYKKAVSTQSPNDNTTFQYEHPPLTNSVKNDEIKAIRKKSCLSAASSFLSAVMESFSVIGQQRRSFLFPFLRLLAKMKSQCGLST
ncbi:MAG: hypothetical protein JEZ14_22640 [Marinilabiliaceae bacterium]|nr:hypothetical protein [Marinilabiliaceae bacterium]